MRRVRFMMVVAVLTAAILVGCDNKEFEKRNQELSRELATKDAFIEEVTSTINEINDRLDKSWALEKNILRQAKGVEGTRSMTQAELKQHILDRISEMSTKLTEHRKRVTDLQKKLKGATTQYAGLETMVEDLRKNLDDREKTLTEMQMRVQNLEGEVSQKTQVIAAHELTIADQTRQLNTAFVVTGKKGELKEKGIIAEEGGFLWGLLGSTTVLAPDVDADQFEPLDKTTDMTIPVAGKIDEIVPRRDMNSYAVEEGADGGTVLRILQPNRFWRESRLVIVTE